MKETKNSFQGRTGAKAEEMFPAARRPTLRWLGSLGGSALPVLIIGGLLYAAFFMKPQSHGIGVEPPVIEKRDHFYGVVMPSPGIAWAAGNDGKIARSTDGGKIWALQASGVSAHLQSIAAWDPQRAVAVGNRGTVIVTVNGGKTWSKASLPASVGAAKLVRVRTYPGGKAWAVGEMGTVLFSSDFGAAWSAKTAAEDVAWNDVSFVNDVGWLVGEFGRMRATRDGGEHWKAAEAPVKSSLNGVYFRSDLDGVAVGTEGVILHTQDGGANWRVLQNVAEEHLYDVLWDGNRWIAVGDKGALLTAGVSADKWSDQSERVGGSSWHTQIAGSGGHYILAGPGLMPIDIAQAGSSKSEETK